MATPRRFTVTEQHVKLMKAWSIDHWDGTACVDQKRPYGNSGHIYRDIAKVVGVPLPAEGENDAAEGWLADQLMALHEQTTDALRVVLDRAGEATPPGVYELRDGHWVGVKKDRRWQP